MNISANPASSGVIGYVQNNASFGCWLSGGTGNAVIGTDLSRGSIRWNSSNFNGVNSTTSVSAGTDFVGNGIKMHTRASATEYKRYNNGTLTDTVTQASSATLPTYFRPLMDTFGGFSTRIISIDFIGQDLSAEASTFNTLINNYLTSL